MRQRVRDLNLEAIRVVDSAKRWNRVAEIADPQFGDVEHQQGRLAWQGSTAHPASCSLAISWQWLTQAAKRCSCVIRRTSFSSAARALSVNSDFMERGNPKGPSLSRHAHITKTASEEAVSFNRW